MTATLAATPTSKTKAFGARLFNAFNETSFCLMMSIGHRTGLFDVMSKLAPSTSGEIAAAAGLKERYVREWLAAMVTARAVDYAPAGRCYSLPEEHAAFLTRAAGADNLAVMAQYLPLLGAVEDDIVECFREGGGVPYERFPRFHAIMAEESAQSVALSLESHILPLVPGLADRLAEGIRVLDLGCGSGRILNRLAELYPRSRFAGIDLSMDAIMRARNEAMRKRLRNVSFVVHDLSDFDRRADLQAHDFVTTFDAVHDQAAPLAVLKGIYRTLRPNGVYLMQDIGLTSRLERDVEHPLAPLIYAISCLHCMTVSLAQGGEGLGAAWGEEKTREYLRRAGFRSIEMHRLEHDPLNNWYVVRR